MVRANFAGEFFGADLVGFLYVLGYWVGRVFVDNNCKDSELGRWLFMEQQFSEGRLIHDFGYFGVGGNESEDFLWMKHFLFWVGAMVGQYGVSGMF